MLPDAPDSDPREILDYLRTYSGPQIPTWVLQAEVCDALILLTWLWWEDRRRELQLLKAGRARGLPLAQLGAQIGVGKQGVLDRIDRLEALLRYDRPDEKITRAARHANRDGQERAAAEHAWIDHNRAELSEAISSLTAAADRYELEGEGREWLDELAVDARDGELTPATMVILGLAAAELRTAPAVIALQGPRPHAVHHLLARIDKLRNQFAELGRTTSPR